jgi:hypothetical protein
MSADIVYLDLNLNGNNEVHPSPLQRQVVRTSPILSNVGEYVMAVARCSIPQMSIPMWQPTLELGQMPAAGDYPTETVYKVTLSWVYDNGGDMVSIDSDPISMRVLRSAMWIVPPPIDPVRGLIGQPDNGFNNVYDMETIVRMNNNAYADAFADLTTKVTAAGQSFPAGTIAPVMSYNPNNQCLTITAFPYSAYQTMETGDADDVKNRPGIQIWYSASYFSYLPGWSMRVYNTSTKKSSSTIYKDVLLQTGGLPGTYINEDGSPSIRQFPTDPDAAYAVFIQEWPGFFAFRSLMKIQILGTGLNTNPEGVDLPLVEMGKGSTDLQSSVICDFDPDISGPGNFQQPLVYTPASVIPGARFIDLMPCQTLQSFNIAIDWQDSLGRSHPMYTFSQAQSASIKLVFVKKDYLRSLNSQKK